MGFVIFAVFYPHNFMFKWVMEMFMMSDYGMCFFLRCNNGFNLDTALVMLLSVTIIGVGMMFMAWANWSFYIHYCFLRGVEMNAKKLGREPDPDKKIQSLMGIPCTDCNSFKKSVNSYLKILR